MRISTAQTDAERDQVFRLRYDVSVQEMGQIDPDADSTAHKIMDQGDEKGILLTVEDKDRVIGTLRLNISTDDIPEPLAAPFRFELFEDLPSGVLAVTSMLAIRGDFQQSEALELLFADAYRQLRQAGTKAVFCHCDPGLVALYEQLGFRRYTSGFFDPKRGYQIPLVLMAEDLKWMEQVRSPLLAAARKLGGDAGSPQWFETTFPKFASPPNTRVMDNNAFWSFLLKRVSRQNISLFEGLDDAEARQFVQSGTLVKCYTGDRIVREGDPARELYLILSGYADAVVESDGRSSTVASISPGQIFGEIGLLGGFTRTADIVARTEVECLVLSEDFLRASFERMPDASIQVCLNLSKILSERLRDTTANWIAAERSILG